MRNVIDFTQDWRFCKTATVLNILPDWEKVALPHTWNAVDGQDGGGDYSTFRVEITDSLEAVNLLCVAVDNSVNDPVRGQGSFRIP